MWEKKKETKRIKICLGAFISIKLSTKQENITPFEDAFRKDHTECILSPRSGMYVCCAELSVLAKSLMTFLRLLLLWFPFDFVKCTLPEVPHAIMFYDFFIDVSTQIPVYFIFLWKTMHRIMFRSPKTPPCLLTPVWRSALTRWEGGRHKHLWVALQPPSSRPWENACPF